MTILSVHNLTKKFGQLTAVDDLSLDVSEGEVIGFLGPNGAGKTTTIRMLTGIISPTSGYAEVAGQRTDGNLDHLHEVIGLLTETPGFYEKMSARRNLEYFAGFYPITDIKSRVEKYLKQFRLWDRKDSNVGTYSKGMKQRLSIARTLLHEPKVLFLDEPTSGLDPEASEEVKEIIKSLRREGQTVFLSTHNLTEAEQLCNRIAVIRSKLLALDTSQNLRNKFFKREFSVHLENPTPEILNYIQNLKFVSGAEIQDHQLLVSLTYPEKYQSELVTKIIEAGGRILEVTEKEHPLEEIYLKLVREER
jgi:ABC-2 type transport system ATP-binding protein